MMRAALRVLPVHRELACVDLADDAEQRLRFVRRSTVKSVFQLCICHASLFVVNDCICIAA